MPRTSPRWSVNVAVAGLRAPSTVEDRPRHASRSARGNRSPIDRARPSARRSRRALAAAVGAAAGVAPVAQHDEAVGDLASPPRGSARCRRPRGPGLRGVRAGRTARSTSSRPRLLVGSSSTSTRQPTAMARAISTSCCVGSDSRPTGVSGGMSPWPSSARARTAISAHLRRDRRSPNRVGSTPSRMFSITERCGASDSSW